jgi:hypothetical protein
VTAAPQGDGPFEYRWSTGANTPSITVTAGAAGTRIDRSVTVRDTRDGTARNRRAAIEVRGEEEPADPDEPPDVCDRFGGVPGGAAGAAPVASVRDARTRDGARRLVYRARGASGGAGRYDHHMAVLLYSDGPFNRGFPMSGTTSTRSNRSRSSNSRPTCFRPRASAQR